MEELSETQKAGINGLTQEQMCRMWRFAPPGHRYFDTSKPFFEYFKKRLEDLGGFTPEISKRIGWQ